jgi:hypothetical protein
MAALNPQAQALIQQFGLQPGVTPDNVANLQLVLNSSPALIDQVNRAAASGELKKLEILAPGTNAGGTYNPTTRAISLPSAMLTTRPGQPFDMGEPVFVLGHELQHGLNRADTQKAYDLSGKEMEAEAKRPAASHDYTPMIAKRLAQNRHDEATAEIAGFNAVVGHVKQSNPKATLADVFEQNTHRMADFIDKSATVPPVYTLKPNLTQNADLTLSPTPANIEAMGQNYFDKAATSAGIGHHGNSDYANYYAASAIGLAVQYENAYAKPYNGVQPRMLVDMQKLGLSEKLLEENGLFLGQGQPAPRPYYDSSKTPHSLHHFDYTRQTHTHVPVAPSDPAHPDHAMLQQIRDHVCELDRTHGREFDRRSEQLSHSLLTLAKDSGLSRVDHVVLSAQTPTLKPGENVFVVQGDPRDPMMLRANMKTEVAVETPVAESERQLEVVNQRLAQEQTQSQAYAQQQAAHGPPAMRM